MARRLPGSGPRDLDEALRSGQLSRRELLGRLGAAGLVGGLGAGLAPAGRAAPVPASERKFLFLYVKGGWDPTYAFAPMFDSPYVATEEEAWTETIGGLDVVLSEERPTALEFWTSWADQCCLVHGMEVRAVTHDQCNRLVLTGTSDTSADDWPSTIAGHSGEYLLPSLVVSGPAYTTEHTSAVVRLGRTAQLSRLLDGTAITGESDLVTPLPSRSRTELVSRYVADRVDARVEAGLSGQPARFAADHQASLDRLAALRELEGELELSVELDANAYTNVKALVEPALTCLELGLSRVAVVEHAGYLSKNWDSHSQIGMQSAHFYVLFDDLLHIMDELATRTGPSGGALLDEVTLVVFSEMGRAPVLNAADGKDHWTFTSVLFAGAGVAHGRTIGAYDPGLLGLPVQLSTGEVDEDAGQRMTSKELGATLLALADIDPGEVSPIEAVMG